MKFKTAIDAAGELIKSSDLARLTTIVHAWNGIDWKEVGHDVGQEASVSQTDPSTINLFTKPLSRLDEKAQQAAIVREFGISVYRRYAPKTAKTRWEYKLTLPESEQVEQVQEKLKDPSFATYKAIMESFKRLLDRFVSMNLTNALLSNGIKRSDALNLNIRQYGCTLEYANIRKTHSLKAYVTAYGPRDVAECPGRALAEKLVYQMGHITESSLAAAYGRLITEVFTLCRED